MSAKPTKMVRATSWDDTVEEAYRFQLAGYRDAQDYAVCTKAEVRLIKYCSIYNIILDICVTTILTYAPPYFCKDRHNIGIKDWDRKFKHFCEFSHSPHPPFLVQFSFSVKDNCSSKILCESLLMFGGGGA